MFDIAFSTVIGVVAIISEGGLLDISEKAFYIAIFLGAAGLGILASSSEQSHIGRDTERISVVDVIAGTMFVASVLALPLAIVGIIAGIILGQA